MSQTWLSQEAYDRLRAELEELKTQGRARMSKVIEEARSHGDLRENAEYDSAKDEQGKMEARIRQLESLLRDAKVGEAPPATAVQPGVVVVLDVEGDEETYFMSSSREDQHPDHEVLSTSSPIGSAIVGAEPGAIVEAEVPAGRLKVTVKEIRRP